MAVPLRRRHTVRRSSLAVALLALTFGAADLVISRPQAQSRGAASAEIGGALPGPLPLLPADNWWNQDVSQAPVDPRSASFIAFINNGGSRRLHPDFGGYE